jgi:G3E family GTPase
MSGPVDQLIPVTVIGGYLGAGKTTLINHLLTAGRGRRLAVLVNDFGRIAIDSDLITAHRGNTIALANGCVCCSITDALGDALDQVLALEPPPDQIVVEASGAADPAKVAVYGQGWPGCRLDAVVVVADTGAIMTQADDRFVGSLVVRQLEAADLVVMTKTDLLDDATVETVRRWLVARATGAVLDGAHGCIDPDVLFEPQLDPARHGRADRPSASSAPAAELFETVTIEVDGPVPLASIEAAMQAWPSAIVRVKGSIPGTDSSTGGGPSGYLVQRVGRRWTIEPRAARRPGQLVLIAVRGAATEAGLDLEALRRDPFGSTVDGSDLTSRA